MASTGPRPHENKSSRLILFDVDGTLVDSDGRPFPTSAALLRMCSERMNVALCSARPLGSLKRLCNTFGGVTYLAASQGGVVVKSTGNNPITEDWTVIHARALQTTDVARVTRVIRSCGCEAFFHGMEAWFAHRSSAASRLEEKLTGVRCIIAQPELMNVDIYKIVAVLSDPAQMQPLLQALAPLGVHSQPSKPLYLEITKGADSTAKGADVIQADLRVPVRNTLAVGDAENDLGMFRHARASFTFEKAPFRVRQGASIILPDPENGGLEELHRVLLGAEL